MGTSDLLVGGGMSLVIPTFVGRGTGMFTETAFVPSIGVYTPSGGTGLTAGAFFGCHAAHVIQLHERLLLEHVVREIGLC